MEKIIKTYKGNVPVFVEDETILGCVKTAKGI